MSSFNGHPSRNDDPILSLKIDGCRGFWVSTPRGGRGTCEYLIYGEKRIKQKVYIYKEIDPIPMISGRIRKASV